jgi:hypothetical protein
MKEGATTEVYSSASSSIIITSWYTSVGKYVRPPTVKIILIVEKKSYCRCQIYISKKYTRNNRDLSSTACNNIDLPSTACIWQCVTELPHSIYISLL